MLRIGLTGGLGAGKSAVGLVWAEEGVHVLSSDAMARALMQPGEEVYEAIRERFGAGVVAPGGELDRRALAREAFANGRLAELNALVHPAVLRAQEQELARLAAEQPHATAAVESALIFEVSEDGAPWRNRFDRIVLVTAPDELKVERYLARIAPAGATPELRAELERDARARLRAQMSDESKRAESDAVIENTGSLVLLRREAQAVLRRLEGDWVRANAAQQPR